MIDFTRARMTKLAIHDIGNKGLSESLTLSTKPVELRDDFVKDTVMRYFTSSFKTDIYHRFKGKVDTSLESVANACDDLFSGRGDFMDLSRKVATHLFNQSVHPKVKSGEFFMCYFSDAMVDGVVCDAVGLFKTENKETFLKVYQHVDDFELECDNGINISRLDKGCLVYNTDRKDGYKLSIIDNNNKIAECAGYWESDFLNAVMKQGAFYHTSNFMDASRGFCEEMLTEANNVSKDDQRMMLNKSTSYFREKDNFSLKDFEKEVLVEPEVIEAFRGYRDDFNKRLELTAIDDFEVSPTAVKKNQKYMRSVVKLDKNFHIYIHSRHDYVEKGYDEERGMKYYKLYYVNES